MRYSTEKGIYPAALEQLARTVRLIRQNAGEWHVRKDAIVITGFSAGGHLAAEYACKWDRPALSAAAEAEREELRPNALVLGYPVITVGAAAPLQEAIIPGLNFGQDYYDALQAEYTHKKDLFLKGLDDLKIVHNDPEGAYYVMLDISEFGYESDLQFCEDLASKVGVGAVPGSSFFREPVNHLIRLHFAKKDETLTDALNRLESLREKIPAKG